MVENMLKGKKTRKTIEYIGKRWYGFDFQFEKTIYCYLCCIYVERKRLKNLDDNLKFESYYKWKQYICNKYKDYSKEMLMEFSRYLNQRMRNIRPEHKYWDIMVTIILTIILTKLIDVFLNTRIDFTYMPILISIIETAFIEIFAMLTLVFITFNTFSLLYDKNIDDNFLHDYKEIIDGYICERFKE